MKIDQQWDMPALNPLTGKWEFRVYDGEGIEIRREQYDSEEEALAAHRRNFIDYVTKR